MARGIFHVVTYDMAGTPEQRFEFESLSDANDMQYKLWEQGYSDATIRILYTDEQTEMYSDPESRRIIVFDLTNAMSGIRMDWRDAPLKSSVSIDDI